MRILQWSDAYPPQIGGIESVVHALATALRVRGHDVSVITSDGALELPPFELMGGIPVYRFAFRHALERNDFPLIKKLVRSVFDLKRKLRPELIHLHFRSATCFFHLQTAQAVPAPSVVTFHGSLFGTRAAGDSLLTKLCESATWVTAVSQATLAEMADAIPSIDRKSSVIYNACVPFAEIPNITSTDSIFAFGRHVHEKGFDLLLEAFALIAEKFRHIHLRLASDGPQRSALEHRASALGLSGKVIFMGWLAPQELANQLRAARLVVVPSRWHEGFGLTALEAALMGRPVVAARSGGLSEVVRDGVTGLVVEPESPFAIANAISRLLSDANLAQRLGAQAKIDAEQRFSYEKHLQSYEELYNRLLSKDLNHNDLEIVNSKTV